MRKRWIWDGRTKELVPIEEYDREPTSAYVLGDVAAYQSQVTGEMVEGRAAHREHLKRHNLVEIGDAYDKGIPTPRPARTAPGLKETLARVVYEKLQYK